MKSPSNSTFEFFTLQCSSSGGLQISSDGDDRMGAKIKTQRNPSGFQQNPKKSLVQKLTPLNIPCQISKPWKKSRNKFGCTLFVELCLWEYAVTTTNLQIVLNTPKYHDFNQATQKNTLQILLSPTQSQNRRSETQKSPLIIPVTWNLEYPPPPPRSVAKDGWGESWDACDTH